VAYQHINFVRDHSKTRGHARLLLLTIATYCDKDGYCYPSYKSLEEATGLDPGNISRYFKQIPPEELIIVQKGGSPKGQKRQHTVYRIPADCSHSGNSQGGTVTKSAPDWGHSDPGQTEIVTKTGPDCCHSDNSQDKTVVKKHPDCCRGNNSTVVIPAPDCCHSNNLTAILRTANEQPKKNSAPRDFFASLSETLRPRLGPTPEATPPETKEQCIERLKQKFPPHLLTIALEQYEQHLTQNGKNWINGRFERLVGKLYHDSLRPTAATH